MVIDNLMAGFVHAEDVHDLGLCLQIILQTLARGAEIHIWKTGENLAFLPKLVILCKHARNFATMCQSLGNKPKKAIIAARGAIMKASWTQSSQYMSAVAVMAQGYVE